MGGSIAITFTSENTALLNFNGRIIPIEHFNFALGDQFGKMLGEWNVVIDFEDGGPSSSPYVGDVWNINRTVTTAGILEYRGCRPDRLLVGACSASANLNHNLIGRVTTGNPVHVVQVLDGLNSQFSDVHLVYTFQPGLNRFTGVVRVFLNGVDQLRNYNMRGFRSGSRRYVQTGTGPSSADPKAGGQHAGTSRVLAQFGSADNLPAGISDAEVEARYGIRIKDVLPTMQAMVDAANR